MDQQNPIRGEIIEEVARDFGLHEIDPLAQAVPLPSANGDHPPLVESLLQALNTLVERLNNIEAAETDSKEKS